MDKFCKVFESEDYGQLVALKDFTVDDEGDLPHIEVYFKPEMMGLCSNKLTYEDSEEGMSKRNEYWNELDLDSVEKIVKPVFDQVELITGEANNN